MRPKRYLTVSNKTYRIAGPNSIIWHCLRDKHIAFYRVLGWRSESMQQARECAGSKDRNS